MSAVVVEEVLSVGEVVVALEQPIEVNIPISLACIKVYLYFQSPVLEAVRVELLKDDAVIFSKQHTFAEIKAMLNTANTNLYGFFPFTNGKVVFLSPGSYKIRLSGIGYEYSHDQFFGWCKDYLRYFGKITEGPQTDYRMFPYAFRLLEYASREK